MSMNRREFIKKVAGVSALLGLGGSGFELLRPGALEAALKAKSSPRYAHNKDRKVAKHWAMLIDVEKCQEPGVMDKIIEACDYAHNIPHLKDPKHEIKWIFKESFEHTFAENSNKYMDDRIKGWTFLNMCNHCEKPPCVRVCPTKATFKRPDGIVDQDYHRCIGCRYCMAACPYGSRSFNWLDPRRALNEKDLNPEYPTRVRGVVEKCTFCAERLDNGQLPACVEAAPEAMICGDLADPNSNVRQILRKRTSMRRKLELGTGPSVFYLV